MLKRILLTAAVPLAACGPYSSFVPYDPAPSKVAGPPKTHAGIALAAVEVFEGDVPYLDKVQGTLIVHVAGSMAKATARKHVEESTRPRESSTSTRRARTPISRTSGSIIRLTGTGSATSRS